MHVRSPKEVPKRRKLAKTEIYKNEEKHPQKRGDASENIPQESRTQKLF